MIFQVTKIEFDFAGDNLFTENDRLDLIEETIGSIWEVDDEDDLIDEITTASVGALTLLTTATFFPENVSSPKRLESRNLSRTEGNSE